MTVCKTSRPLRVVLGGALFLAAAGCGSDNVAQVSGVVTLNGQPTAGIAVSFEPIPPEGTNVPGPSASGVTGADGRYTMKTVDGELSGAATGKNRVKFCAYVNPADINEDGSLKTQPKVKVPAHYWTASKIEFDVPKGGTSAANFDLKSP